MLEGTGTAARHDHRRAVAGGRKDVDVGVVKAVDQGLGHHLPRRADGLHPAVGQGDQLIAVTGGHAEVMDHDQHRAPGRGNLVHGFHHLGLVADVQRAGGFVEQDQVGVLRQDHAEPGPLRLATRERGGAALPDRIELHHRAGACNLAGVFRAPLVEPALMRMAAVLHQLFHADAFG